MYILGVKVDNLTRKETLEKINQFLISSDQHYITTPNPEIVLWAQKDEEYQDILNYADLAVADGTGLVLASILFFGWKRRIKNRIRGVDLVEWLCQIKQNSNVKFFLLGGGEGTAQLAADKIKEKCPRLKISGAFTGPRINTGGWPINNQEKEINCEIIEQINQVQPEILLVGFGAPKQEKWINNYLTQISSVKVAIGVGGTFDFLSGKIKQAPKIWQKAGLEWLWRLIQEPKRIRRIFNATIIFLIKIFNWKLRRRLFYRSNVCVLVYQDEKLFLAQRTGEANHWQMPQGGLRKEEEIEEAVKRELKEELGTDKFKIKKIIYNVHKYRWPKKSKPQTRGYYPYKGQKQTLCLVEFIGTDSDIKLHQKEFSVWQWVSPNKFIETIHPYRREIGQKALEEYKKLKV